MERTGQESKLSGSMDGSSLNFFAQAIERYKQMESDVGDADEDSAPLKKRRRPDESGGGDTDTKTSDGKPISNVSLSSDSVEKGSQSDFDGEEGGSEIERKRFASRVSSRRTRERERLRLDHYQETKVKLKEENEQLKEENDHIRKVIEKIKEAKMVLDSLPPGSTAPVTKEAMVTHPNQVSLDTDDTPHAHQDEAAAGQPQQQALASLLLTALGQAQAKEHLQQPQVVQQHQQQQGSFSNQDSTSTEPIEQAQEQLSHIQQILSLLKTISTNPLLFNLLVQFANLIQTQQHTTPAGGIANIQTMQQMQPHQQQTHEQTIQQHAQPQPQHQQGGQAQAQATLSQATQQSLPQQLLQQLQRQLQPHQGVQQPLSQPAPQSQIPPQLFQQLPPHLQQAISQQMSAQKPSGAAQNAPLLHQGQQSVNQQTLQALSQNKLPAMAQQIPRAQQGSMLMNGQMGQQQGQPTQGTANQSNGNALQQQLLSLLLKRGAQ